MDAAAFRPLTGQARDAGRHALLSDRVMPGVEERSARTIPRIGEEN